MVYAENAGGHQLPLRFAQKPWWTELSLNSNYSIPMHLKIGHATSKNREKKNGVTRENGVIEYLL